MFWNNHKPIIAESVPVTIEAVAGEPNGPKKFSIIGYTGGILATSVYPNGIVIDLAGMDSRRKIVANLDHNKTQRVGHVTATMNDGKTLKLDGVLSASTPARNEVIASAQDGFEWEASVEATPTKIEHIKAGASVDVNGQTFQGPIQVARKSTLHGIAFVSMGADSNTSVSVAASAPQPELTKDGWLDLHGIEAESMNDAQKAFLERSFKSQSKGEIEASFDIASIQGLYETHVEKIQAAIAKVGNGISSDKLKAIHSEAIGAIQNLRATACEHEYTATRFGVDAIPLLAQVQVNLIRAERPSSPSIHASTRDFQMDQKVLEASFFIRTGREEQALALYGEQTVEAARLCGIGSLRDVERAIQSRGDINAASTMSLPNILSNVTGKVLLLAYQATTTNWRTIASIRSAADFKPQKAIRPSAVDALTELGPDSSITHTKISEENIFPWNISTFAKMLIVTRKDIVNDDLSFFDTLAPALGTAAGRSLNNLFWKTFLNHGSYFTTGNKNLQGATSALSISTLASAISLMRKQVDKAGNTIEMSPFALIVPPELEATAKAILNSALIVGTSGPSGNPMMNIVPNLVVEPRLSNTTFTGNSAVSWYLTAPQITDPIIIGFLNGKQNPVVETQAADFDTLGLQMRCYFDYGCALGDPKAAVKSTGAA